jgi:hypothetical protein
MIGIRLTGDLQGLDGPDRAVLGNGGDPRMAETRSEQERFSSSLDVSECTDVRKL